MQNVCHHHWSDIQFRISRARKNRENHTPANSIFLLMIASLHVPCHVLPVSMMLYHSRSVDTAVCQGLSTIFRIINHDLLIELLFCSANGAAGHQCFFDGQFSVLFPSLTPDPDDSVIVDVDFNSSQARQLGDSLDVMKNAQFRIFQEKVHDCCAAEGSEANSAELARNSVQ
jgi:hypothetical protein